MSRICSVPLEEVLNAETAAVGVLQEKMFLEILQNSQ